MFADRLKKAESDAIEHVKAHGETVRELMQQKMDLAIEGAGYKAEAKQLREQLNQQSRQIDSWVNHEFLSRISHAQFECCDIAGSLID